MAFWDGAYGMNRKRESIIKEGQHSGKQPTQFIYFHSVKNMVCTYLKNLSLFRCVTTIPQLVTFHLFGMIFFFLRGKFAISRAILSGLWWNVRYAGATYRKRQRIQSLRCVADGDYLPAVTKPVGFSYHYHQYFGNLRNYTGIMISLIKSTFYKEKKTKRSYAGLSNMLKS